MKFFRKEIPEVEPNANVLCGSDDQEKVSRIIDAAIREALDTGYQSDKVTYIQIPVTPEMTHLGTGIWSITDDGRPVRYNDLFSEILKDMTGYDIYINGMARTRNADTNEPQAFIMGQLPNFSELPAAT